MAGHRHWRLPMAVVVLIPLLRASAVASPRFAVRLQVPEALVPGRPVKRVRAAAVPAVPFPAQQDQERKKHHEPEPQNPVLGHDQRAEVDAKPDDEERRDGHEHTESRRPCIL